MPPSSQRAQPRVKYPADVRLFADRFDEPLSGRARDLGTTGIFVEADERLSIGTPVICEVTLPSGPVRLTGLVTREQALVATAGEGETVLGVPQGRVGLGIHFINVEDSVRAEIEALIPKDERSRPLVALHLEGMTEALRSPAELTSDGANVIATLPALRQGNEVKLSFLSGAPASPEGSGGASRSVVRDVRLVDPGADGSPRLELRLQFMPIEAPSGTGKRTTRTDFPPSGTPAGAASSLEGIVGELGDSLNEAEEDKTDITAIHTPSGIAAASLGQIILRDRALTKAAEGSQDGPLQLRAANIVTHRPPRRISTPVATAAPAAVKVPAPAIDGRNDDRGDDRILPPTTSRATRIAAVTAGALALIALGVGLGQFVSTSPRQPTVAVERPTPKPPTTAPSPAVVSPSAEPAETLLNGPDPTTATPPLAAATPPAAEPPVAATPPAAAAAKVAATPPAATAPVAATAPAAAAATATTPEPSGTGTGAVPPPATTESAAPPNAPREAMATAEAASGAGIKILPEGTPGPEVIVNPSDVTAVVPVTGSTAGAVKYPIPRPHGIAVDLPEAQAALALGRHPIFNDGFRFVSIRPRAGGGIRITFTYAYYTPRLLDVTVDDAAVRVRVAPPSRPAAP